MCYVNNQSLLVLEQMAKCMKAIDDSSNPQNSKKLEEYKIDFLQEELKEKQNRESEIRNKMTNLEEKIKNE